MNNEEVSLAKKGIKFKKIAIILKNIGNFCNFLKKSCLTAKAYSNRTGWLGFKCFDRFYFVSSSFLFIIL